MMVAAASCGATGDGLGADCSNGACEPIIQDASLDGGAFIDSAASPPDAGSDGSEIARARSALCAVSGCFPGLSCTAPPSDDAATLQLDSPDGGDEGDDDAEDSASPAAPDAGAVASDASLGGGGDDALGPILDASFADVALASDARGNSDALTAAEASQSDTPTITQSCYVAPSSSGPVAVCATAGTGAAESACQDSRDCAVGLACVQVDGVGKCELLSCGLPPSCTPLGMLFYQLEPLISGGTIYPSMLVPVCVPIMPCNLLETPSVCVGGKVCAVVGSMGETSCVTPGSAKRDQYCDEITPCAEGLVCAMRPDKTQNRCLQICHVNQDADQALSECPGGTCQGGNMELPTNFGICVGDNPDAN